jgi:hypothetical protein
LCELGCGEQSRLRVLEPTFFRKWGRGGRGPGASPGFPNPPPGPPRRPAAQGGKGELCTALRPRTWAQGAAATEQVHGTYAKTANQRLSYCRWCWLLPTTPQMPKRRVLAFGIAPNTQRTNCNTLPAPHRPVLPPGSSMASCGKSPAARRNQDGPTTPPKRNSAAGTALSGTWDAADGHLNGTWPPRVARSYPPFVTQRNLLNKGRKTVNICRNAKHIYIHSSYGWIGQQSGSGFSDRPPAALGVFASSDRL